MKIEKTAEGIQKWFDSMEDSALLHDEFTISWSMKGIGFGQYGFYTSKEDGKIHIANECMGKESIKKVLGILVDSAVLDDPSP